MAVNFTSRRLLLVIVVFAGLFALTRPLGIIAALMTPMIGVPLSALVLIVRRDDWHRILRTLGWCLAGMLLGAMFYSRCQQHT